MNYKFFFCFIFLIVQLLYGQFFYTGYNEAVKWNEIKKNKTDIIKNISQWDKYYSNYLNGNKEIHSFGLFIKSDNNLNNKIIYKSSDLIGDGILTKYQFKFDNIEIYNSMFFTDDSLEALRGYVRTIKDVTMYTNQSYLKYKSDEEDKINFEFKIGRDFNVVGYGINANLFLSNYSRPFDQLFFKIKYNDIESLISVIELDTMSINSKKFNRYLYLHAFEFKVNNINLILGESIIISEENHFLKLKYFNPFYLWSWQNTGSGENGMNAFLFSGFSVKFNNSNRIYGEILIDDINFHKKNAFFMNRYGYLLGIHKIDFPFSSSNLWIEFSSVMNQVYQSFHPSHIYNHNGFPIGHFLGNDFTLIRMHYSQLNNKSNLKFFFDYAFANNGENGLDTIFSAPWENEDGSLDKDYRYPGHPTKPIQREHEIDLGFEYKFKEKMHITLSMQNQKYYYGSRNSNLINGSIRFWSYIDMFNLR